MTKRRKPKLSPGELVGERYRIDGVVGQGGFGAVYRATQLDTGISVALKVLIKNFSTAGTDFKRFQREASLVQKLHHPNVVELLDYGQTERGESFIAFELLEGRALSVMLKQDGKLPVPRAGRIARDVLGALEAAHALGIIHRDIKPQNIFLCDGSDTTKVLDFGIAKAVTGEEAGLTQLTEAGQMIGTPHYMAPEQVRGTGVYPATDLYSLGLLMAEMLSGERVVKAASLIDVYMQHINDLAISLPKEATESPFAVVIERAVAKALSDRYKSAAEMAADLDRALAPNVGSTTQLPIPVLGETSVLLDSTIDELNRRDEPAPSTVRHHEPPPPTERAPNPPQSMGSTVVMPPVDLEQKLREAVANLEPRSQKMEDPLNATVDMTAPVRVPREPTPPSAIDALRTSQIDVPSSHAPASGFPDSHASGIQPSPLYSGQAMHASSPYHSSYQPAYPHPSGEHQLGHMSGEHPYATPETQPDPGFDRARNSGVGVMIAVVAMLILAAAIAIYVWAP